MTPAPPTERELLAWCLCRHEYALRDPDEFTLRPEDSKDGRGCRLWQRMLPLADHLIAAGWVRWEAAKHVCRDAALNAIYDAIPDLKEHARVQEFTYYAFDVLTPPKGTER